MSDLPAVADRPKSLAERLGHHKDDRLLLLHADDIGMCHSVNAATTRAMTEGVVSTGAIMVPCPWFPEIAAWSREHPQADLGLHLTLTAEWKYYRWRPVAPIAKVKGLVDKEGFLWRSVREVVEHAKPVEVAIEIRAQIERARQFGLQPTHVDTHMGTLFASQGFFEAYIRVAKETGIMPMLFEDSPEIRRRAGQLGLDYAKLVKRLRREGYVLLDHMSPSVQGDTLETRQRSYHEAIRNLGPGVTLMILHLSGDDPEIHHVTNNWKARYLEGLIFTSKETRDVLAQEKVKLIGYGDLGRLFTAS